MKQGLRIAVEGNIGVGKSTLLPRLQHILQSHGNWGAVPDRAAEDPEYKRLYQAENEHIRLQSLVTRRRLQEYQAIANNPAPHLFEGSFFGDLVFCQAHMLRHETPAGDYIRLFYEVTGALKQCPYDAVLYLKASPEACFEHIKFRARDTEVHVSLDDVRYLNACFETHLPAAARAQGTPVITVDWDRFGSVETVADQLTLALDYYAEKQKKAG